MLKGTLPVGSAVAIQGHSYRVYGAYSVKLRLFVNSNIVTVSYGDYKLYGTAKIKRFANLLGIMNQSALIHCFFQQSTIVDSLAETEYFFHSFTEENIFKSWTT